MIPVLAFADFKIQKQLLTRFHHICKSIFKEKSAYKSRQTLQDVTLTTNKTILWLNRHTLSWFDINMSLFTNIIPNASKSILKSQMQSLYYKYISGMGWREWGGGGVEQVLFSYDIALVDFSDNIPLKWYLSLVVDQQDTIHYKEA